jgi:hypothetical protein
VAESANRVSRAKAGRGDELADRAWMIDLGSEPELRVSVVDFALTALGSGL